MARTRATAAKSRARAGDRASSSGGSGSRGASRGSSVERDPSPHGSSQESTPSSRALVGNYDLAGLPAEWDQSADIRERMRNDLNLTVAYNSHGKESNEYVTATTDHVKLNACVLRPLAELMAANNLLLPAIDRLIFAIEEYYNMAKRSISHEKAYHEAWSIRRLIGKMKRNVYRQSPPEDPTYFDQRCSS